MRFRALDPNLAKNWTRNPDLFWTKSKNLRISSLFFNNFHQKILKGEEKVGSEAWFGFFLRVRTRIQNSSWIQNFGHIQHNVAVFSFSWFHRDAEQPWVPLQRDREPAHHRLPPRCYRLSPVRQADSDFFFFFGFWSGFFLVWTSGLKFPLNQNIFFNIINQSYNELSIY